MLYATGDWHIDHQKILTLGKGRPHKSLEEMKHDIISKCNEVVQPNDELVYCGDLIFGLYGDLTKIYKLREQINCKHISYILGNHDKHIKKNKKRFLDDGVFESIQNLLEIKYYKQNIVFCHYPILSWNGMEDGFYHCHAHCHQSLQDDPNSLRIDIGVDGFNYYPASFDQISERMSKKQFVPVDHHV